MLAIIFVILEIFSRLAPHIPNFSPITAAAIFGGYYINKRFAFIVPFLGLFISDYILYPEYVFHSTTIFVYSSFLVSGLIGITLKKLNKPFYILGGTIFASLQFFIITNFGVWLTTNMYPHTLEGLIQCYIMGVPFYRNTLLGDLFYVITFFLLYKLTTRVFLIKLLKKRNYHK